MANATIENETVTNDQPCPAIFVTGTDTGVGKSIVTAAIARHLTSKGLAVGIMKPVETGVEDPTQLGADATLLKWAAQSEDADEQIAPFRYPQPLAPCQAAELAGNLVDVDTIVERFNTLRQGKDIVLIEGAGGLMVPIRGGFLMADLAARLETPLLLVTHPRLGTLNHTLLTSFTARAMQLDIAGFIINNMPQQPGLAEEAAPHLLASLASCDILGVLPETYGNDQEKVTALAAQFESLPTYQWLLMKLGLSKHPAL
ncbi:MAG: dethiobiotin synthase [Desulfuromonadales bacterium]|nr:dethiobiotin synthase [Desulfuromonadales bacterium]